MNLSVVIPAYNRAQNLSLCLNSLCGQTLPAKAFEVIVVDHSSTDNTKQVVHAFTKQIDLHYKRCDRTEFGAAAPRNQGITEARGDILVFVDTDHILAVDFLEKHYKAYKETNADAVIGQIFGVGFSDENWSNTVQQRRLQNLSTIPQDLFELLIQEESLRDPRLSYLKFNPWRDYAYASWPAFWTGNASIRHEVMSRMGAFDEHVHRIEDIEMGLRLVSRGFRIVYSSAAKNFHFPHSRDWREDWRFARRDEEYLFTKYPNIETEILATGYSFMRSIDVMAWAPLILEATKDRNWSRSVYNEELLQTIPNLDRGCLLVGYNPSLTTLLPECFVVDPTILDFEAKKLREANCTVFAQVGTHLNFETHYFQHALVTDYWRYLPSKVRQHLRDELTRVARNVWLLLSSSVDRNEIALEEQDWLSSQTFEEVSSSSISEIAGTRLYKF